MLLDSTGRPISATPAAPAPTTKARVAQPQPASMHHAFDAAKRSGYRGWFYFPDLDISSQMPQWTRDEIHKKVNWLYNNSGAVRMVIDGLAIDEVDTGLWPKPATKSRAFNKRVKTLWNQQCGYHKSFSSDGEQNFYSAQLTIRREIRLRGDAFGQKLRSGEGATTPQLHLLPGYQCANATTRLDQSRWREGRADNALGRAMQFRFLTPGAESQFRDVSADDIIHFHDPFLIGQKRGLSDLAPVAKKLFSVGDIENAATSGVLLRSRIAYAIEKLTADSDSDEPILLPGTTEVETVTNEDGSKTIIQKIVSSEGSEVEVADLPANRKLRVIESSKASESTGWISQLLTDVAWATKYPGEYIFALAGLTQGTLVRMTQQKVQRVVNTVRDFQIVMQLIDEWWSFWLWDNIRSGRLDDVPGGIPDEWWPYLIVRPRDMTVDPGREGRLYDERVATGRMPVGLYVGMIYGEDEEEFDEAIIRDAYRRRTLNQEVADELGEPAIPLEQIFRPPSGSTQPAAVTPPDDDPEDQPAGSKKPEK